MRDTASSLLPSENEQSVGTDSLWLDRGPAKMSLVYLAFTVAASFGVGSHG